MNQQRILAYTRRSFGRHAASVEEQRAAVEGLVSAQRLGDPAAIRYYSDPAKAGKVPIRERQAGRAMLNELRSGDVLVVASLDRMFASAKDLATEVDCLGRLGVKVHVCDCAPLRLGLDPATPTGKMVGDLFQLIAGFGRTLASERTCEGLQEREGKGVRHTQHAGYGFQWVKQRQANGKIEKVRVPDHAERETMATIVWWRMHTPPWSWDEIEKALAQSNTRTRAGKAWDKNRIRRAYRAELTLRLTETPGEPSTVAE